MELIKLFGDEQLPSKDHSGVRCDWHTVREEEEFECHNCRSFVDEGDEFVEETNSGYNYCSEICAIRGNEES